MSNHLSPLTQEDLELTQEDLAIFLNQGNIFGMMLYQESEATLWQRIDSCRMAEAIRHNRRPHKVHHAFLTQEK